MQQQIAVVTLGVARLDASRRFYVDGFGWRPVFENEEIVFYQMNGLVLGTWLDRALREDARLPALASKHASKTTGFGDHVDGKSSAGVEPRRVP